MERGPRKVADFLGCRLRGEGAYMHASARVSHCRRLFGVQVEGRGEIFSRECNTARPRFPLQKRGLAAIRRRINFIFASSGRDASASGLPVHANAQAPRPRRDMAFWPSDRVSRAICRPRPKSRRSTRRHNTEQAPRTRIFPGEGDRQLLPHSPQAE